MDLSHFSLKDTWVTFVFFVFVCLDVLIIALVLFSSSGNSLHLWISIAKTHHLWMVSWTNIRTLLSGLMNIPSTRVFL